MRTLVIDVRDRGAIYGYEVIIRDVTAGYSTGGDGHTELAAIEEAFAQYLATRGARTWLETIRARR